MCTNLGCTVLSIRGQVESERKVRILKVFAKATQSRVHEKRLCAPTESVQTDSLVPTPSRAFCGYMDSSLNIERLCNFHV